MSRIGKKPIPVPQGVEVKINGDVVEVKGPKGSLHQQIKGVQVELENNTIRVIPDQSIPNWSAMWGLMRSLINNMVVGVSQGFKKVLLIQGREYSVKKDPRGLILNLGYSHPVEFPIPEGIDVEVDERAKIITLTSADKHLLGQVAADIRAWRPVEPYKGKGIRYSDEHVIRKVGKKALGK